MYLEADVSKFVASLEKSDAKPLYELTPQEARAVLLSVQADTENLPAAEVDEISVPLGNGRTMRVQIIKPEKAPDTLPVVFYIHGGGWVMGDDKTHARLVRTLALETGAAVVFPIYEQSPEAQYPQTTTDLFAVLQYMTEHGAKFSLDFERLALAGDSVGGNMALVMGLMSKANKAPNPIFMLLLYPVAAADFETESYEIFAQGPWLTRQAMQWFWQQYAPDKETRSEVYASPLNASQEELSGLPATLIITDENDVLRDEGESLAMRLNEAGVKTASVRINGTIHDFLMLNALSQSASSEVAMDLCAAALKRAFAQKDNRA